MNQFDRPGLQDVTQQCTLIYCYCRTMPVSCTESEIIIFLNDEEKKVEISFYTTFIVVLH